METKHTPTPCQQVIAEMEKIDFTSYSPDDGHYESGFDFEDTGKLMQDHFETIRRVCNAHDELVRVMEMCKNEWPERLTSCYREMGTALAKARGDSDAQ